ncbi:MAG: two-component regulator propeller domain-containing protein [Bacteroidales bacterium]
MYKGLLYILLFLIPAVSSAKVAVGEWLVHPIYGTEVGNIIESNSDNVYYLVNNNLYAYNKVEDINISYNLNSGLSDVDIDNIYYNYDKGYLLITYSNSNIDLLYDDGQIINLPDIKYYIITSSKDINDINFDSDNNMIYVATDFGFVVFNDIKNEVTRSQIYYKEFYTVARVGDMLVASFDSNMYITDYSDIYIELSKWSETGLNQKLSIIRPVNDNTIIFDSGWTGKIKIGDNYSLTTTTLLKGAASTIQSTNDDGYLLQALSTNTYIVVDEDLNEITTVTLSDDLQNSLVAGYNPTESVWIVDENGLKNSSFTEDGGEMIYIDYFKPNASTVSKPYNMVYNKEQEALYVMNSGSNKFTDSYGTEAAINILEDSEWSDVTPAEASTIGKLDNGKMNDPYQPVFDPEDANTYYVGSWYEGVYKITDGVVVNKYDWTNSPLQKALDWYCLVPSLQFDDDMNLWIIQTDGDPAVMVLPRDKQSLETVTEDDWIVVDISGLKTNKRMSFLINSDNIKFITDGAYGSTFYAFDDNGTPETSSDDTMRSYNSFTDQDGSTYSWNYINCFVEDMDGSIWIGTDNGVVEITSPTSAIGSSLTINRIKVPRNDGTNYADYLLENVDVTAIAVDGANRKWIGTSSSGVFLVNEYGTEVLKQFTSDNSYLMDNQIVSIVCNEINNSVYFGTELGIAEYGSDASPASASFGSTNGMDAAVYAYPNPVTKDYTGVITITGLMDNTLVKIADSMGNQVYSTKSVGGMATWSGSNSAGVRVATGVYFVFMSQTDSSDVSSGAVAKILIVN